jgi:hypothetical protein
LSEPGGGGTGRGTPGAASWDAMFRLSEPGGGGTGRGTPGAASCEATFRLSEPGGGGTGRGTPGAKSSANAELVIISDNASICEMERAEG